MGEDPGLSSVLADMNSYLATRFQPDFKADKLTCTCEVSDLHRKHLIRKCRSCQQEDINLPHTLSLSKQAHSQLQAVQHYALGTACIVLEQHTTCIHCDTACNRES